MRNSGSLRCLAGVKGTAVHLLVFALLATLLPVTAKAAYKDESGNLPGIISPAEKWGAIGGGAAAVAVIIILIVHHRGRKKQPIPVLSATGRIKM